MLRRWCVPGDLHASHVSRCSGDYELLNRETLQDRVGAWTQGGGVPGRMAMGCMDAGWWGAWTQGGGVPGRRVVWCLNAGWWGAWTQGGGVPGMLASGCSKDACLGYIYV